MDLAIPSPGNGQGWLYADSECTVVIATTGTMPQLLYERCKMEPRRELLLVSRMDRREPNLAKMVQLAMKLCTEGALPAFQKKYKREFMIRCNNALALKLGATCPSESSAADQRRISHALDGHATEFDGCFGCWAADPEWQHACPDMHDTYGPVADILRISESKHPLATHWITEWVVQGVKCKCGKPRTFGRAKAASTRSDRALASFLREVGATRNTRTDPSRWSTEGEPESLGCPQSPKRRRL